jgi:hypothetical protein
VAKWHSGKVAQWQSGTVAKWHSGKVAQWQSGTVAEHSTFNLEIVGSNPASAERQDQIAEKINRTGLKRWTLTNTLTYYSFSVSYYGYKFYRIGSENMGLSAKKAFKSVISSGDMAFGKMTFSLTTLGLVTLGIKTFRIAALSIIMIIQYSA